MTFCLYLFYIYFKFGISKICYYHNLCFKSNRYITCWVYKIILSYLDFQILNQIHFYFTTLTFPKTRLFSMFREVSFYFNRLVKARQIFWTSKLRTSIIYRKLSIITFTKLYYLSTIFLYIYNYILK